MYDYLIIGSGPSGSVLGARLAEAGARCLMLEAGERFQAQDYPRNELTANARLMWNGGMDATDDARMVLLRGKVLGGGSVINQCLLDRFDALALDDWRARSGIDGFSPEGMAAAYTAVEARLH